MNELSRKLNLGCGNFPKEGFVNVDNFDLAKADLVHDLNSFPYPFADNQFDLIECDHVLEHLEHPFKVMAELFRIGAPGATIRIKVPHFSRGFTHADHRRGFDFTFPYYFDPDFPAAFQGTPLKLRLMELHWMAQPYLKKLVLSPGAMVVANGAHTVFSWLANLSPLLCSRIWCFWVGGFEEIQYDFEVVKNCAS